MKCCKSVELSGKNVLITGGALGMGKSLAGLFLKEGARVAIVDIREADLEKARAELGALGTIQSFVCDVSNRQQVYAMADKVKRDLGTIDILVNNAGIVRSDAFMDKPDEALEKIVGVNLMALCWTIKAFLPGMMAKGEGLVVNVASAGGLLGVPFISDYCATKFAVVGLTESLRQEMRLTGHKNIRFSYVCPNTVNTGMFAGAKAVKGTKMLTPEDVTTQVIEGIKKGKAMIGIPSGSVYMLPIIKALLPIPVMDFLCRVLGIAQSSQTMTGRRDSIAFK